MRAARLHWRPHSQAVPSWRIAGVTRAVDDGDVVMCAELPFHVIATPCHTAGHVAYWLRPGTNGPDDPGAVFTGDTLFTGGCGRFFEGTPAAMLASLDKLAALPPATAVYCGHEYTWSNLEFGATVEPANAALAARLVAVTAATTADIPTVPSTIAEELATNVFMRVRCRVVAAFTHPEAFPDGTPDDAPLPDPVEVMARLRAAKNAWRPPPFVAPAGVGAGAAAAAAAAPLK